MKVLYVLQQSIIDQNGKWVSADSNINMLSGFLQAWALYPDSFEEVEVDVMIAPLSDFSDIESFDEICNFPNVRFIQCNFYQDAMLNRYHFDAGWWSKLLTDEKYDVIINCMTEQSRNIKTILFRHSLKAKLVTQCFWMDTPLIGTPKVDESISIMWRQIDGMECSDLCVFTCDSTLFAFFENAGELISTPTLNDIKNKSVVWDFGYSEAEAIRMMIGSGAKLGKQVARIGFLNRISSYDYTNFDVFREALLIVKSDAKYADRFEVVVTNPSKRLSDSELAKQIPNFVSFLGGKKLNRREYWDLLISCSITVHLFEDEYYGGCALRESIAAKNLIVTVDVHEQKTLVTDKQMKVPEGGLTAEALAAVLKHAIDGATLELPEQEMSQMIKSQAASYAINRSRCSFEATLEDVIYDLNMHV
jgi:hypothetical protein